MAKEYKYHQNEVNHLKDIGRALYEKKETKKAKACWIVAWDFAKKQSVEGQFIDEYIQPLRKLKNEETKFEEDTHSLFFDLDGDYILREATGQDYTFFRDNRGTPEPEKKFDDLLEDIG